MLEAGYEYDVLPDIHSRTVCDGAVKIQCLVDHGVDYTVRLIYESGRCMDAMWMTWYGIDLASKRRISGSSSNWYAQLPTCT